jgi:phospholipid/cholesterol/gamma-HCH transport system ATP-binding protein
MNEPFIEFRKVSKKFGQQTVLDRIDLVIYRGEVTTLIGKSGSGKSVILKHMIGLIEPDEGSILYNGRDWSSFSKNERKEWRRKISYMFQRNALFDSLNVFENVAFPLQQTTRLSAPEIAKKVRSILEQIDLLDYESKYPAELSGGTQKRVALGRALVTDPEIVLFDEPTTGQDIVRRNVILSMIAEYQKTFGFTAIVVSHDIPDIFFISNTILVLYEGQIVFQGSPEEFDDFKHPFVEEFTNSLLAFRENLTGLYSLRTFKSRYQKTLNRKSPDQKYVIAVFTLADFAALCKSAGHVVGQTTLKKFGDYLNEYFNDVGAFSTRQKRNVFITFLPFSDKTEAAKLVDDFVIWLRDAIAQSPLVSGQRPMKTCAVTIFAGVGEGLPRHDQLNDVVIEALKNQKEVVSINLYGG